VPACGRRDGQQRSIPYKPFVPSNHEARFDGQDFTVSQFPPASVVLAG